LAGGRFGGGRRRSPGGRGRENRAESGRNAARRAHGDLQQSGSDQQPGARRQAPDGQVVLAEAVKSYQKATGTDPSTTDPNSRQGRLLRAMMAAIVAATD